MLVFVVILQNIVTRGRPKITYPRAPGPGGQFASYATACQRVFFLESNRR
jgi:hypothetical protein